jgi:hypothetical protein
VERWPRSGFVLGFFEQLGSAIDTLELGEQDERLGATRAGLRLDE